MEHKKDIGKAIRDKLDALDKAPGNHLWAAIEADLPKKKKRRFLPFWIGLIGVIIIGLLILTTPGVFGSTSVKTDVRQESDGNAINGVGVDNNHNGSTVVQSENSESSTTDRNLIDGGDEINANSNADEKNRTATGQTFNGDDLGGNSSNTVDPTNPAKKSSRKANAAYRKNPSAANHRNSKAYKSKNLSGQNRLSAFELKNGKTSEAVATADKNNPENSKSPDGTLSNDTETSHGSGKNDERNDSLAAAMKEAEKKMNDSIKAVAEQEKKAAEKAKDSLAKQELVAESFKTFRIFLYVAPTYYNTFSKISSIDKDLDSLPRKAEITYNYGGYLAFDYDDKWAIRVGIAKTKLRYRTQGIPVSTLDQQNYYNVDYGSISNLELQTRFADSEKFDLVQDVTYLELPVELKYNLIDNKFGIEGIGGISTSLLKSNTITAESDNNGSVVIGSTKDQYKAYFSVNVGAGFYWKFADNFRLNIEPIFKYHFRTASTALQPYSVVVLGGLEYTFNWRTKKKADKK